MNVVRLCKRELYRTNEMARFIFFTNGRVAALKGVYPDRKKEREKTSVPKERQR